MTAPIGEAAPRLTIFTIVLLLLLYGYEIFNFSLSIDEELYGYIYQSNWWLLAISQGRWALGLLGRLFPPIGDIPMLSTALFCLGLGASGCLLARLLFRKHSAQIAFVVFFVSSPLWPHLAEFNISSWEIAIGCFLMTLALLFFLAARPAADVCAACLLAIGTGIYESLFVWFLALVCIRYASVRLGMAPVGASDEQANFPWLRGGLVTVGGMLGYLVMRRLFLAVLSLQLTYIQGFVRLSDFTTSPAAALSRTLQRCSRLLLGADPLFLGYGRILTLLPLLGLLILVIRLFWRGTPNLAQRLLSGLILVAALLFALSPLLVSAGTVPSRALIAWIPTSAFLAGAALSFSGRFEKLLYAVMAAALLISAWISVSLFYTDHLARQRDQVLATRIMIRVDNIVPNPPPGRIPFVVIGELPATTSGPFHKLEIFGDSFFDTSHEGGNPWRVAAYLKLLGVDTLEPHPLSEVNAYRGDIEPMPVWPAAGSVTMIRGMLVIKLGPLPAG